MIPLAVPNLTGNEKKYLDECIDTTFVSSVGPFVTRLESMAAEKTGAIDAVATSAGTTALHASLIALGVRQGDLVIVPSFTFIASANSIKHAGADPWFFDIDPSSWCLDVEQVANELDKHAVLKRGVSYHKETGQRIAAIMPVYTLGNIPDMDALRAIADAWNLPIISDAACAIGATFERRELAQLAELSAISLNGNKTVTAGGGGLVIGRDESLLEEVRHLTTTARVWPDYDFDRVGYNYRLTNLQAAVGVAQLEQLETFVKRKRQVRAAYDAAFSGIDGVSLFPVPATCESACWFSGIVLEDEKDVRLVIEELNANEIGAKAFWKPVHLQVPYSACLRADCMDVTETFWNRVITLPCSTGITDEEIEQVISTTMGILGK